MTHCLHRSRLPLNFWPALFSDMIFYILFQWINSISAIPLSSYYDTDIGQNKLTQKERFFGNTRWLTILVTLFVTLFRCWRQINRFIGTMFSKMSPTMRNWIITEFVTEMSPKFSYQLLSATNKNPLKDDVRPNRMWRIQNDKSILCFEIDSRI